MNLNTRQRAEQHKPGSAVLARNVFCRSIPLVDVLSGAQCGQSDPLSAWDAFAQEQRHVFSIPSPSPPLSLSLSLPLCLSAFKLELNESIESSRLGHLGACPKKFFSRGAVDDQLCEPSLGVEPVTLM